MHFWGPGRIAEPAGDRRMSPVGLLLESVPTPISVGYVFPQSIPDFFGLLVSLNSKDTFLLVLLCALQLMGVNSLLQPLLIIVAPHDPFA